MCVRTEAKVCCAVAAVLCCAVLCYEVFFFFFQLCGSLTIARAGSPGGSATSGTRQVTFGLVQFGTTFLRDRRSILELQGRARRFQRMASCSEQVTFMEALWRNSQIDESLE